MAVYRVFSSTGTFWGDLGGTANVVNDTTIEITHPDGTITRLIGSGFTEPAGGTIDQMQHFDAATFNVFEALTGLSYSSSTFLANLDTTATFATSFNEILDGADDLAEFGVNGAILRGLGGDDNLFTSGSSTAIDGGDGTDRAQIIRSGSTTDELVDFTDPSVTQSFTDGTTVVNVESVELTTGSGNDTITGTANIDTISTGAGNDTINNGGGRDSIYGGDGDDVVTIVSGAADGSSYYTLDGGIGTDKLVIDRTSATSYSQFSLDSYWYNNYDNGTYVAIQNFEQLDFTGGAVGETAVGGALDDVLRGGGGGDTLHGRGGTNVLLGQDGDDSLISDPSAVADTLDGGEGTDFAEIQRQTSTSNETVDFSDASLTQTLSDGTTIVNIERINLYTGSGNDTIIGSIGQNYFFTQDGNDSVVAGRGDQVQTGDGDDTVTYKSGGPEGYNTYLEGGDGDDLLVVDLTAATSATYAYLGNGGGFNDSGWGVQTYGFERVDFTGTSYDDQIVGSDQNDTLRGGAGRDYISGGSGDDVMDGGDGNDDLRADGGGADTVLGGDGDDYIIDYDYQSTPSSDPDDTLSGGEGDDYIDSYAGVDTIDGGDGSDHAGINRSYSTANETFTLANVAAMQVLSDGTSVVNVESVSLNTGSGNDSLSGGAGSDGLFSGAGSDVLDGGAGRDYIDAGDGDDTVTSNDPDSRLNGGTGTDKLIVNRASYTGNLTIDILATALVVGGGPSLAAASEEEIFEASLGDGTYYGGFEIVDFTGGSGNDSVGGGNFVDVIRGGAGRDLIDGRDGNDLLYGGTGNDSISGGAGADQIRGDDGTDVLEGNDGNDTLNGGAGIDVMEGGDGDDVYVLEQAGDIAIEDNAAPSGGYDTLWTFVTATAGENIESVRLQGTANINATGNALDNFLTGNSGNNTLNGEAGADVMRGGAGNDVYVIDNVGDVVNEDFGAGYDTLWTFISATAGANVESVRLQGTGDFTAIGNSLDNYITGNGGSNVLAGAGGRDVLIGNGGNDYFYFGAPNQTGATLETATRIADFTAGDKLHVANIDANTVLSGDQAFLLNTNATFDAGEYQTTVVGADLFVEFNVDGGATDMAVLLEHRTSISATDFIA